MQHRQVELLILDFGSQYTQLIARRVRELQVYCEIVPFSTPLAELKAKEPRALILSGGPRSVFDADAPAVDPELWAWEIPMLGICYGMQLMCHALGGDVESSTHREYGAANINLQAAVGPLVRLDTSKPHKVWMSHGDRVNALPPGFACIAASPSAPFAAMAHQDKPRFGLQFHPEVNHTEAGKDMLAAFVSDVAKCRNDWTPASFVDATLSEIQRDVGDRSAICGLSGGVDSSVAAVLVAQAIGQRLTCIFVDNGLLRQGEAEEVVRIFGEQENLQLLHINAADEFLTALKGVQDPEQKRKIIGKVFIDVFEREAGKLSNIDFLVQGTLYPDVIESVSMHGPSAVIKSHHNVGGLPERMQLKLIEPLRELFKDEVRQVGETLAMPHHILYRQPFPGPGLAIRCLGEISAEKLDILRQADAIADAEVRAAGLYESIWQSFCVILPVRTVGVMGDARSYEYVIALRAVESRDGMTADWARLPYDLLERISSRIINEVQGCNRVVYDISSKPPATIEWE